MTIPAITMEELRRWLADGRPVSVLDVRQAANRAEWSIPGSRHADAYDALWAHDPDALKDVDLPMDRPVVTVCNLGKTSLIAAEQLKARGYDVRSLVDGMKGWSLAWNEAALDLPAAAGLPAARVIQVRRTGKGCLSYVVGSGGEAVIIDAACDPGVFTEIARREGWTVKALVDTHIHADHLCRSRVLEELTGAPAYLPATDRARYANRPLNDGDEIEFGGLKLTVLNTPGHTPESISFRLDDRVLFSGDTLFTPGIGRPDLEATPEGARIRAGLLFHSLRRLLALPPAILVMGGHTSYPIEFDGRVITLPLSEARATVDALPQDEATFVEKIVAGLPATPPNHQAIVQYNEQGEFPAGNPADLEMGANRCAVKG